MLRIAYDLLCSVLKKKNLKDISVTRLIAIRTRSWGYRIEFESREFEIALLFLFILETYMDEGSARLQSELGEHC